MNYRTNEHNLEYIMLDKYDITLELSKLLVIEDEAKLTPEQKEIKVVLISIWNKIGSYRTDKGTKPNINEIAIHKNSKLGRYVLNYYKENKIKTITLNQIIHTLLISIEDSKWDYYASLSCIIKNYKDNNINTISYNDFQNQHGQEITDFIVKSSYRTSNINNHNNKNVYLYNKNNLIKTELPEQTKTKPKTKTRTK